MKLLSISMSIAASLTLVPQSVQASPEPMEEKKPQYTATAIVVPADAVFTIESVPVVVIPAPPPPPPPPAPEPAVDESAVDSSLDSSSSEVDAVTTEDQKEQLETSKKVFVPEGDAQKIARDMVLERGWTEEDFACLVELWTKESNWRVDAENKSSGAYGIPQSLPGEKMAAAGEDWRTNPATQITWGLDYIAGRYGTPCNAWNDFQQKGWY